MGFVSGVGRFSKNRKDNANSIYSHTCSPIYSLLRTWYNMLAEQNLPLTSVISNLSSSCPATFSAVQRYLSLSFVWIPVMVNSSSVGWDHLESYKELIGWFVPSHDTYHVIFGAGFPDMMSQRNVMLYPTVPRRYTVSPCGLLIRGISVHEAITMLRTKQCGLFR